MSNSDTEKGEYPVTTFLLYGPFFGALTIYIPTLAIIFATSGLEVFDAPPHQLGGFPMLGLVLIYMVITGYILGCIPAVLTGLMIERYKKDLSGLKLYLFSGAMGYATIFLIGAIITFPTAFLSLFIEPNGALTFLVTGLVSSFIAGFLGIIPGFVCGYITYRPKAPDRKKWSNCRLNSPKHMT